MTWLQYLAFAVVFFAAAVAQVSFFPFFTIMGAVPSAVFIVFFLLVFFEPEAHVSQGLFAAIVGGLLLDMFSPSYFGICVAVLLVIYGLSKFARRFLDAGQGPALWVYFLGTFSAALVVYSGIIHGAGILLNTNVGDVSIGAWAASLLYNLAVASTAFYLARRFGAAAGDQQLTLP